MSSPKRVFKLATIEVVKGMKKRSRYTKVNPDSVFVASSPGAAASKAFSKFCKLNKKKLEECTVKLAVKEDGKEKLYGYNLKRVYAPKTVVINGTPIVHNYSIEKKAL